MDDLIQFSALWRERAATPRVAWVPRADAALLSVGLLRVLAQRQHDGGGVACGAASALRSRTGGRPPLRVTRVEPPEFVSFLHVFF